MFNIIGKVEIDLANYKGKDVYSDGFIEGEILDYVKSSPKNIDNILFNEDRWPILYHFSPYRRNLLEWYDFSPNATFLEIGAGCGALTGLFCEKNKKVVAVELSKRRAEIIAYRYQQVNNLKIKVGNLQNIKITETFDYISLIGVLEYANLFMEKESPYEEILLIAYSYLKKEGKLILAIENKFGLKYWNGAAEDHTGIFFEGIENYRQSNFSTFSKKELTSLLYNTGYHNIVFYYPYPDYKLPEQIFSDYYLPKPGQVSKIAPNYDRERFVFFDEGIVFNNLITNNLFDFFANSFLIFAEKR